MNAPSRSFPSSATVSGLLLLIFVLIGASIFRVELPLLIDYPNHLARFWLLLGGARDLPLSPFYAVDWGRSSLVGVDLLAVLVGQFVPYTIAGKVLVFLALAGPPAGAACLSRLNFGRWHWWQLSFPLLTWSTTGLYGFLAFQISLALALFFTCLELYLPATKGVKVIARILFGTIILFFHPFGLGFYMLTLFAMILGPDFRSLDNRNRQTKIVRETLLAAPALVVPVVCLLLLAPVTPGKHMKTSVFAVWSFQPHQVLVRILSPFLAYQIAVDLLFFMPLLVIIGYSLGDNKIRIHAGAVIVGLFLCVLSVFSPLELGDEGVVATRFPIMAALMLFAGVLPDPFDNRAVRIASAAAMFCLAFARLAYIDQIWQARQSDILSLEGALSHVPPGAKVFALQSTAIDVTKIPVGRSLVQDSYGGSTLLRHTAALAIPQRQAFVPFLFAIPGQQPLRLLPPWDGLTPAAYLVPDVHVIDKPPSPQLLKTDPYLLDWDKRFDYIVMIGMDHEDEDGPFDPPAQLRLVSDNGYARLYRIVK